MKVTEKKKIEILFWAFLILQACWDSATWMCWCTGGPSKF